MPERAGKNTRGEEGKAAYLAASFRSPSQSPMPSWPAQRRRAYPVSTAVQGNRALLRLARIRTLPSRFVLGSGRRWGASGPDLDQGLHRSQPVVRPGAERATQCRALSAFRSQWTHAPYPPTACVRGVPADRCALIRGQARRSGKLSDTPVRPSRPLRRLRLLRRERPGDYRATIGRSDRRRDRRKRALRGRPVGQGLRHGA